MQDQNQVDHVHIPQTIMFDNQLYYNSKDLLEYNPVFYYGCKSKPRTIIEKKHISKDNYTYANFNKKNNGWKHSDADCKKAQLLFTKNWVDTNYFKTTPKVDSTSIVDDTDVKYQVAPKIIELKDEEKFTDQNGEIIEIETRGEQTEQNIYFKVVDVAKGFGMNKLNDSLCNSNSGFCRGTHYETFIQTIPIIYGDGTVKRYLYLTYSGICRVLFASHNKDAKRFQSWAVNKLFTIQMGTEIAKKTLGAKLCGVTVRQITDVFGKNCADRFPCIYLLSFGGTVSSLRTAFGINVEINDDLTVYKFGFTGNFVKRLNQHVLAFGKMKGVTISVVAYHNIDTKFACDAEGEVRDFCQTFGLKLKIDKYNEIIALNSNQLKLVKKQYKYIGTSYAGSSTELQKKIDDLQLIIKDKDCLLKDTIKTHLMEVNDHIHTHLIQLKDKDMVIKDEVHHSEILAMKLEMNVLVTENTNLKLKEYSLKFGNL